MGKERKGKEEKKKLRDSSVLFSEGNINEIRNRGECDGDCQCSVTVESVAAAAAVKVIVTVTA